MTRDELEEREVHIESYGHGFIVADYSGERKDRTGRTAEAVYAGARKEWVRQPISIGEPFATDEDAIEFASSLF